MVGVNNFRVAVAFVPGLEGWVCLGLVTAANRVVGDRSQVAGPTTSYFTG